MYTDEERRNKIGKVIQEIHRQIPRESIKTTQVGDYEIRKGFLAGKKIKRLIVYMRSSGCAWKLENEAGGCTMCGHLAGTTFGAPISAENYMEQFKNILSKFDFAELPMVCIYNAGSFFNEREMPKIARKFIFEELQKLSSVRHVIFESRAEYILEEEMNHLRSALEGKTVEIGVGLESSNDFVRQVCLNKGVSTEAFLNGVNTVKRSGNRLLAYVLLKPPFLEEKEAIEDSVSTIKWAFEHGVDVVSLEPVSVQNYTLTHLLFRMKQFRPPWIWSVFEVVRRVAHLGLLRIGGFEFFPPPTDCTHNCSACNTICVNAIEEFNATNDVAVIESAAQMECRTCKATWAESLSAQSDLRTRIDHFLDEFDISLVDKYLRNDFRRYPNRLLTIGSCVTPNI